MITFGEQGHILWTPNLLYQLAVDSPRRLINDFLLVGTPAAFQARSQYCDFLEAIAERTGVHPRNLFLRGSCQIGFSIAPKSKVWTSMNDGSDLDLAIVDAEYFGRLNQEIQAWADHSRAEFIQGNPSHFSYNEWQRDRQLYNCCRAHALPLSVCVHHQDTMTVVADMRHCGLRRDLQAFIFRDWWSVRRRYEFDLDELVRGVRGRRLTPPSDEPLPPEKSRSSVRVESSGTPFSSPPIGDVEMSHPRGSSENSGSDSDRPLVPPSDQEGPSDAGG